MFELKQILAFVHVAENRSFSTAAMSLNVSQPTLSKRIRDLEDSLGVVLLERTTKSVTLTKAGMRFLDDSRKILALANRMELSALLESNSNRLIVGIAEELYPLSCFKAAFFSACSAIRGSHDIDIRPNYFDTANLHDVLDNCDVVLTCSGDTLDQQRYKVSLLHRQPLCFVTKRRAGYGSELTREQVAWELRNAKIVWYPRSRSNGVAVGQISTLADFRHPAIEWIDSGITALTCVEFDKGVAIMPMGHDSVVFSDTLSYYGLPIEDGWLEINAVLPQSGLEYGGLLVRELLRAFGSAD